MTLPDARSSIDAWTQALAKPTIAPAGGSAGALAGAMAASVIEMVAGITLARERYAAVHTEAEAARAAADSLRQGLLELAHADALAFASFGAALELPDGSDVERVARSVAKREALAEGGRVQLEVLKCAAAVATLSAQFAATAPPSTLGDSATATFLATATARSAYWAVRSDLKTEPEDARTFLDQAEIASNQMTAALAENLD